jgi:hypothetical protein
MFDDYDDKTSCVKKIPLPDGANILAGRRGFDREMAWRKQRNKELAASTAYPNYYKIFRWEELETYFENGNYL